MTPVRPDPPPPAGPAGLERRHPAPSRVASRPERVCPNCSAALIELKCKLLCPRRECGYYMSCSDFY
jgi:hypothetical protein